MCTDARELLDLVNRREALRMFALSLRKMHEPPFRLPDRLRELMEQLEDRVTESQVETVSHLRDATHRQGGLL
jgi:hypothetical protein